MMLTLLAMILVLPWYPIYHLQMPLRQRLTIVGIFLLGGFVTAAGVARVVFISQGVKEGGHRSCGSLQVDKMFDRS